MHAAIVLAPLAALAMFTLAGSALGQAADDAVLFKEEGKASYYGGQFHGRPTASGEPFDQNAMTAAHPKLPLGAEVTVTDPATGRQVEVEVNDRGPYADGRAIDLSQGAAKQARDHPGRCRPGGDRGHQAAGGRGDRPPKEVPKVERQLEDARDAAAAEGTPQPKPLPALDPPAKP